MPGDKNENALELEVQSALVAISQRYQAIQKLVDDMLEKQQGGKPFTAEMKQLEQAKRDVLAIERTAKDANERYRVANEHASAAVQKLTEDSAQVLTSTIKKIDVLEQKTRAAQQKLLPQIGENVRANQMQKAYGDR
jgi:hypothetical protein